MGEKGAVAHDEYGRRRRVVPASRSGSRHWKMDQGAGYKLSSEAFKRPGLALAQQGGFGDSPGRPLRSWLFFFCRAYLHIDRLAMETRSCAPRQDGPCLTSIFPAAHETSLTIPMTTNSKLGGPYRVLSARLFSRTTPGLIIARSKPSAPLRSMHQQRD